MYIWAWRYRLHKHFNISFRDTGRWVYLYITRLAIFQYSVCKKANFPQMLNYSFKTLYLALIIHLFLTWRQNYKSLHSHTPPSQLYFLQMPEQIYHKLQLELYKSGQTELMFPSVIYSMYQIKQIFESHMTYELDLGFIHLHCEPFI